MCKSEIARQVIEAVATETEIPAEEILGSGKTTEIVDARFLAVYFLYRTGFYPTQIARYLNRSAQSVRSILHKFDLRRKQSGKFFEINLQHIRNKLDIN